MTVTTENPPKSAVPQTIFSILLAISFCHLLNDMVQSLIPAIYPVLKTTYHLNFAQIGLITLTFQITASLLQPLVGLYTDHRARPYSLPFGMAFTMIGLVLLSRAVSYPMLLVGAGLVGSGSAVFHPESSRVARMASGGRPGMAQSIFQVGGNAGSAIGPLLAAFIVIPRGQHSIIWFCLAVLLAIAILIQVGHWYHAHEKERAQLGGKRPAIASPVGRGRVAVSMAILVALVFSKFFYLTSISTYYTFYLITKFHVSVQTSQLYLFGFLGSVAAGTLIGGPIGDKIGRKTVIWISILGVLPFSLALPHANLFWTAVFSMSGGIVLASAMPAILVYAQDLMPGKIGMVSGLFMGLAFGMGGIGAAVLGKLADVTSIAYVYQVCAYLPAIGLLAAFLPNIQRAKSSKV